MEKIGTPMLESVLHTGISTFMKSPFVPPKAEELKKVGANVAYLGIPFEGCAVGIPGASFGPRMVRIGSDDIISYNYELDVDIADHFKIVDCGDVPVIPMDITGSFKKIEDTVAEIVGAGVFPIIIGGDHSITLPAFKGFYRHTTGNVGLIHFDTHMDTSDTYGGMKISNCTQITRIAEMERVNPKNIVQIGIRNHLNPKSERLMGEKLGIKVFPIWEIFKRGIEPVMKEAVEIVKDGTDAIYITLDIDVLDAAYAPATSVPTPGGLTSRQLIEAVRIAAKAGVDAFDLVEVSGPQQDPNFITGRTAATIIAELLAAKALK
ncbi:agmatinase [Candidatus Bathyarchaeota archaeon]|nr:MAG: agmatinase [Candidatus Bathyarchaeota archaeon]